MNDGRSTETAGALPAEIVQVRENVVELLERLGRPPRHLRVQAGSVAVDITWADAEPGEQGTRHEPPAAEEYLTSPGVGVFYHAREPGAEPFVSVGSAVKPGQQVGIIEAMKLMVPVAADREGTITAVLVANGEPVQYDEPLFAVETREAG